MLWQPTSSFGQNAHFEGHGVYIYIDFRLSTTHAEFSYNAAAAAENTETYFDWLVIPARGLLSNQVPMFSAVIRGAWKKLVHSVLRKIGWFV